MGNDVKKERDFFDKPENIKKMKYIFYLVLAVFVLVDFVVHRHVTYEFEEFYGFFAIYGFLSSVLVVAISKFLGIFLKKKVDYYD